MNENTSESDFYRDILNQICQDKRKTRARRLAESALTFWDQIKKEAAKRIPQPSGRKER